MRLYMIVTADQYELPLMVTDKTREVAEWMGGASLNLVHSLITRFEKEPRRYNGKTRGYNIVRVDVEEGE